ncbi:uncharacterized protein LOC120455320 isoform X2 [Drosophila santomea]|uniref:uncharacterized protein LOC120455320 isoform X2 n=1 Tax=Drosophila santomea TaxID=129105 RepID=UPI00195433A3|nr:uncharacterized protein LOC120455320 isoform X2 [Drosophila santomea]
MPKNEHLSSPVVEVLSIYDVDYERILKPHMLKQWNEKKLALRAFDYFDFLTPDQIILACKYSYLVQYEPLETIYMGDKDSLGYVRFVLSGECVILQCLSMKVTNAEGEVSYELAEINKDEGLEMFQSWKDVSSRNSFLDIQDILASSTSSEEVEGGTKKKQAMRKMGLAEIQKFCGIRTSTTPSRKKSKPRRTLNTAAQARKTQLIQSLRRGTPWLPSVLPFDDDDDDDDDLGGEDYLDYGEDIYDDEIDTDDSSYNSSSGSTVSMDRALVQVQLKRHSESTASEKKVSSSSSEIFTASSMINEKSLIDESAKTVNEPVETHFIDVGSLTYGSVFGLGEKMEHRVIMARTVVQCLLLPRFWLLEEEQNPGNIWHRRRFYFECNVPSRQDLFTNFLKTRQWNKFRRDYIESLLNREEKGNITKEEDIPIMCRIVETSDDAS